MDAANAGVATDEPNIPQGIVDVVYTNGVTRTYHLEPGGVIFWVENGKPNARYKLALGKRGDFVGVTSPGGEVQRWTFAPSHVIVENYPDTREVNDRPHLVGIGAVTTR